MRSILAVAAVAGALAAGAGGGAAAAATPAPPACRPVDGLTTHAIASRRTATGSEVTEYSADGGYTTTRCTAAGAILASQVVAPVALPGGGDALLPVSTFTSRTSGPGAGTFVSGEYGDPADPAFARAWREEGPALRRSVLAPTAPLTSAVPRRARAQARASAVGDSCTNREYHFEGPALAGGRYAYVVRRRGVPGGAAGIRQIRNGHITWVRTRTDCGFGDVTAVRATYAGTTRRSAHSARAPDGVNVVDFGRMRSVGCSDMFTACTVYSYANGVNFSDVDTRFNRRLAFSTTGATGTYDLWSTAAHETGHAVGLAHATSSRYLTMYPQSTLGATWKRTLGLGDAIGLRCRYGVTAGGC